MFLHVKNCRYVNGFSLKVEFDSGEVVEVDLEDELHGEIFEPLNNSIFFRKFKVNPETGTVEWPNGADFAPEFLREKGNVLV